MSLEERSQNKTHHRKIPTLSKPHSIAKFAYADSNVHTLNWPTEDTRVTMENSSNNMNSRSEELVLLVKLDNDYPRGFKSK